MTPARWNDPWRTFPSSRPIPVEGGLTTRRQRGAMAESWWSRRFVEVLESYGLGARMQRGRRYARTGQVMSLDISAGLLAAQVQGSRRTPYLVTIGVTTPTARQWRVIDKALGARVGLTADLLAGEVPPQLEEVFAEARTPLFPLHWADLRARCTCPDSANPCKHVAAVLYVFADRLDTDPWLLLEWRGRGRDDVLAAIGLATAAPHTESALPPWWPLRPGEPLPDGTRHVAADLPPSSPARSDAVLRRLDDLDVSAWHDPATSFLGSLYTALAQDRADRPDGRPTR